VTNRPDQALLDRIWAHVDQEATCQLALDLTAIPSPTGEEAALADFIVDWFARQGFETIRQEVEEGRANAVGILPGRGNGPSLMFNGHMDTGTPMRHEDITGVVPSPAQVMAPRIEDGLLFGTGMDNMKSGLAAIMSAATAVKASGVSLGADLFVVGVAGEIGRAPVDQYVGRHYRSKGVGTRFLLTHGIVSDYAVVADTSHFGVTWAECGVVYAKISTSGRGLYTPFTRRTADPRESGNAVIKMTVIIEALERWAADYEAKNVYPFGGGQILPKVSIGAISAGAPFRVSNTPLSCSVYLDVRIPPNRLPIEILRELRTVLDSVGIDYRLDPYLTQRGYEHAGSEPLVEAINDAHRAIRGTPAPQIDPAETSMWTDTNLYHEAAIPAVKFGIGAAVWESSAGELGGQTRIPDSTSVPDLIDATKIYAAVAATICGAAE
jgi:acetylornithine deacetylase/succinyl-diaminopimelate desuccinylase-like protein